MTFDNKKIHCVAKPFKVFSSQLMQSQRDQIIGLKMCLMLGKNRPILNKWCGHKITILPQKRPSVNKSFEKITQSPLKSAEIKLHCLNWSHCHQNQLKLPFNTDVVKVSTHGHSKSWCINALINSISRSVAVLFQNEAIMYHLLNLQVD